MELGDLKEEFSKELICKSDDMLTEYAEIGIENIFNNGIVDEIPVIKTISAICNVGLSIRDRFFAKKLIMFINDFRNGTVDRMEFEAFKGNMKIEGYKSEVTETLMIKIEAADNYDRVSKLSKLFIAFINKKISWDEFREFSHVIQYLTMEDYETLKTLYNSPDKDNVNFDSSELMNLKGSAYKITQFSLVDYTILVITTYGSSPAITYHKISDKGIKLYEVLEG